MARGRLVLAALAAAVGVGVAALPALATAGPADRAPVVSRGARVPAFYNPPAVLPAANGTVIRTEPLPLLLVLPGTTGPIPGRATRLLYRSTDSSGAAVAVSGSFIAPSLPWRGPGPRPLVVFAPGTMGQGDQCSASLGLERIVVGVGDGGAITTSIGYENLGIYRLLARGIAVAQTDYVGLGVTDRLHTYVNRVDGGHAVLDAARAARVVGAGSITATSPVGLFGYSQGGGATASAAELQPSYAPDVPLRATYAGAPPANLSDTMAAIDGTELVGAMAWAVNGFVESDPGLRPLLDRHMTAAGRATLKDLETMCDGDAILKYAFERSSNWTKGGLTVSDVAKVEPAMQATLDRQSIGRLKPAGAVRVATGVNDNLVPHRQARQLAVDWCRLGGDVTYEALRIPAVPSALMNHTTPLIPAQDSALTWITGRLAGQPSHSTCASLPSQP